MNKTIEISYDVKTGKAVVEVEKLRDALLETEEAAQDIGKEGSAQMQFFGDRANDALGMISPQLQGIVSGAKGMGESIRKTFPAFKGLKGAIISTGIGALIVLIGELIANFDAITEFFRDKTRENALKRELESVTGTLDKSKEQLAIDQARGRSAHEIERTKHRIIALEITQLQKEKEIAQEQGDQEKALEASKKLKEKQLELTIKQYEEEQKLAGVVDEAKKTIDKTYKAQQDRIAAVKTEQDALDQVNRQVEGLQAGMAITQQTMEKAAGDTKFQAELQAQLVEDQEKLNPLLEQQAILQQAVNKKLKEYDEEQKRIASQAGAADREARKRKQEEEEKARQEKLELDKQANDQRLEAERALQDEINQLLFEAGATAEELEIMAAEQKYNNLLDQAAEYNMDVAELERAREEEIDAIQAEFRAKRDAQKAQDDLDAKERSEKERERELALQEAKFAIAQSYLSALSSLTQLYQGQDIAKQRRMFEISKGISIAQTTISTFQGIVNALSAKSIIPEPIGQALKIANAAAIGAAGAANIAQIRSTRFQGGGGGGAGSASMSSGGMGGAEAASTAPSVDFGFLTQGANQTSVQAYVIGQDVTNQQQADQLVADQSRL